MLDDVIVNVRLAPADGIPIPPETIIQQMPGRRYRIHPRVVPAIATWLLTVGQQFRHQLESTEVPNGHQTVGTRAALRKAAQQSVGAVDTLINSLLGTVDAKVFDQIAAAWYVAPTDPQTPPPAQPEPSKPRRKRG